MKTMIYWTMQYSRLAVNEFNGLKSIQLNVEHVES